jgi:hypothetical protein
MDHRHADGLAVGLLIDGQPHDPPSDRAGTLPPTERAGNRVTAQPRTLKAESLAFAKPAPPQPTPPIPTRGGGISRRTTIALIVGAVALVAVIALAIGIPALVKQRPSESSPTSSSPPIPSTTTLTTGSSHAVSKTDVAQQITSKLTDAAGNKPDSVTCPGDLPANVGAQVNCEMKVKNQTFNVNVTVTSVNGNDVKFDMVETVDKNQVASQISDKLAQQVGRPPDSVTCPNNLKGVEGATLRCQLTDGSEKYGISVTVTSVDAGDVNFDFKVDDHPS